MNIREVANAYAETDMVSDHVDEFLDKVEEEFGEEGRTEFVDLVVEHILKSDAYK